MLDILYLDNHLLVVNKPAGVPVQEDRTGDVDLLSMGKAYLKKIFSKPGNVFLGLVHRLDRPVSGVMVFARTTKAASRLSEQFRLHSVVKKYLAMVEGECSGEGILVDYIIKKKQRVYIVEASHPQARRAELLWQSRACRDGVSLIDVHLKTGRPHQIRIQLSHLGFPIMGDFRYGASREFDSRNLALHCYRLGLKHPTQNRSMDWSIAPPTTWGRTFSDEISNICQK